LPRNPLSSAISKDEGKTWGFYKDIEDHKGYHSAYSAVTFVDDEVLVTYYGKSDTLQTGTWISLKIFKLDWFYYIT
jgi:hypothetical protein